MGRERRSRLCMFWWAVNSRRRQREWQVGHSVVRDPQVNSWWVRPESRYRVSLSLSLSPSTPPTPTPTSSAAAAAAAEVSSFTPSCGRSRWQNRHSASFDGHSPTLCAASCIVFRAAVPHWGHVRGVWKICKCLSSPPVATSLPRAEQSG